MTKETSKMKLLFQIFITFLKMGPVTFGGGYAMVPLIEREVVQRHKWIKSGEVTDIISISGSVPGAIVINSATFVGYRLAGVPGAIVAMLGTLIPTFLIIVLLSLFFLSVQDHPMVKAAFVSIRATVVALITYAAIKFGKTALVDKTTLFLILASVLVLLFALMHPVLLIVFGSLLGVVIVFIRDRLGINTKLEQEDNEGYIYQDYYIGDGI